MATVPPPPPEDQPTTVQPSSAYTVNVSDIARLPIPGNAEFLLYLVLEIAFTLIWWISDDVGVNTWMTITTALTFGYFISRGIAKASRVLEQ